MGEKDCTPWCSLLCHPVLPWPTDPKLQITPVIIVSSCISIFPLQMTHPFYLFSLGIRCKVGSSNSTEHQCIYMKWVYWLLNIGHMVPFCPRSPNTSYNLAKSALGTEQNFILFLRQGLLCSHSTELSTAQDESQLHPRSASLGSPQLLTPAQPPVYHWERLFFLISFLQLTDILKHWKLRSHGTQDW